MKTRYDTWQDGEVLDELDEDGGGLTAWEIDFIEQMSQLIRGDHELSPAQKKKLREIAEERLP